MYKKYFFVLLATLTVLVSCGGGGSSPSNTNTASIPEVTPEMTPVIDSLPTPDAPVRLPEDTSSFRAEPNKNEKIRIPLFIWIVTSSDQPNISYDVTDEELQDYVDGANLIWRGADIEFFIEQIKRIDLDPDLSQQYANFLSGDLSDRTIPRRIIDDTGLYTPIFGNMNIVLLKEFGSAPGTAFLSGSAIFLAEKNESGEIRRPTILAHEIGHALSLRHVNRLDVECNLMNLGKCGSFDELYTENGVLIKSLHPCQVGIARASSSFGFATQFNPESITCFNN